MLSKIKNIFTFVFLKQFYKTCEISSSFIDVDFEINRLVSGSSPQFASSKEEEKKGERKFCCLARAWVGAGKAAVAAAAGSFPRENHKSNHLLRNVRFKKLFVVFVFELKIIK